MPILSFTSSHFHHQRDIVYPATHCRAHILRHEQLSRAKDSNKITKKGKGDTSSSGTASPSNPSPAGSAQATPTSSTHNLVDSRGKPSASSGQDNSDGRASQSASQTGGSHHNFMPPDAHPNAGLSAGAPTTPGRFGGQVLPPSVVISPSAPVSRAYRMTIDLI